MRVAISLRVGAAVALLLSAASSAAGDRTVSSEGLTLVLSPGGAVESLRIRGIEAAGSPAGSGFALRELPQKTPNLAPNGSFEEGQSSPASWSWSDKAASWTPDGATAADGRRSMRLDIPGTAPGNGPVLRSAEFALRPNSPYTFSCRVESEHASRGLGVTLVELDAAGKAVRWRLTSRPAVAGWQTLTRTFMSGPVASRAYFQADVSRAYGTARLDDIQIRDVYGGRVAAPVRGAVVSTPDGGVGLTAEAEGVGLTARFTGSDRAIRVDVTLADRTGKDRALEIAFRLPLAGEGWLWDESLIHSAPVVAGSRFENLDEGFGSQTHSSLPFASVRTARASISLAVPPGPQMQRFACDTREGFRSVWDLGLSPAASKMPSRATISFWIYAPDPRWGLRSSAERYYALEPAAFASDVRLRGGWVLRGQGERLSEIPGSGDFGWGFHEGTGDLSFDNANGILALQYIDPNGWFRRFPGLRVQPPYETLVSTLEADAAAGTGSYEGIPVREMAKAVLQSSPYDESGRFQFGAKSYFWFGNRLQIYPVSPDPDIPPPSIWSLTRKYVVDRKEESSRRGGRHIDGVFLDDLTGTFASLENHRRSLWAYSDRPLSTSWETGKVVLYNGFSMTGVLRLPPRVPSWQEDGAQRKRQRGRLRLVRPLPGHRGRGGERRRRNREGVPPTRPRLWKGVEQPLRTPITHDTKGRRGPRLSAPGSSARLLSGLQRAILGRSGSIRAGSTDLPQVHSPHPNGGGGRLASHSSRGRVGSGGPRGALRRRSRRAPVPDRPERDRDLETG